MASSEELNAQIEALRSQLSSLQNQLGVDEAICQANPGNGLNNEDYEQNCFKNNIDEIRYDIDRMESFLADLSQRGGNLMTVAGLISLMPYAFLGDSNFFLKYYVFWIFPFLIVAIFSYVMSSFRNNTYRTIFKDEMPTIFPYNDEYLRTRQIWLDTYKNYRESLIWHRISSIATQLFIIDYILNFYTLVIY